MWSSSWNRKKLIRGLLSRDYPDLPAIMDKPLTAFATRLHIYPTAWTELIHKPNKRLLPHPLERQEMSDSGLRSSDWTQLLSLAGIQLPHLYQLPKDI